MGISISMSEMLEAGVHFGHRKSRWHPKMKQYIYGVKNNIHIVDLNKSALKFAEVLDVLRRLAQEGKVILFVGTKPQASEIVREAAKECGMPYVINRWLGGTMTNFITIKSRLKELKDLEGKKERGEFDIYTKRERLSIDKKIADMEDTLGGIKDLRKIPDAMFITDIKKDHIARKEARVLKLPLLGIADTNTNPNALDYVIPGNDDSIKSLKFIYSKIVEAVNDGKANPVEKKKEERKEIKTDAKKEVKVESKPDLKKGGKAPVNKITDKK